MTEVAKPSCRRRASRASSWRYPARRRGHPAAVVDALDALLAGTAPIVVNDDRGSQVVDASPYVTMTWDLVPKHVLDRFGRANRIPAGPHARPHRHQRPAEGADTDDRPLLRRKRHQAVVLRHPGEPARRRWRRQSRRGDLSLSCAQEANADLRKALQVSRPKSRSRRARRGRCAASSCMNSMTSPLCSSTTSNWPA